MFVKKIEQNPWSRDGKGLAEFQDYIRQVAGFESRVDTGDIPGSWPNYSRHGAVWVSENLKGITGKVLAYLIAAHHAGLPDWYNV